MRLAIIGATGLVGRTVLRVLEEHQVPIEALWLVASEQSHSIPVRDDIQETISLAAALAARPTVAIFSAGTAVSVAWAPRFAAIGTRVIDNSTAWRMHPDHKLIVPEINGNLLQATDRIIANPNCSTIQLVLALFPLHQAYQLQRVVIATYQAVTGSGKAAVEQLMGERQGQLSYPHVYPHPIDLNLIPHIDDLLANGYTKEEMKMVHETQKILGDETIRITATAVRVPVLGGHALAVNAEFARSFDLSTVVEQLRTMPGIVVMDDPIQPYSMPRSVQHRDAVYVGRIRRDLSQPNTLHLWIVADNLRKGAATNAVQIAQAVWQRFVR